VLYLVSGASRSGKTIIANNILKRKKIPFMSLDWLVMGFTNGMPQCGIHDKLYPDEIAEKLWNILKSMCENMLWSEVDYVIEGEAILPGLIRELLDKYPERIKIYFVRYADIDVDQKVTDIRNHSDGRLDWLLNESDDHINKHIEDMVTYSRKIRSECRQYYDVRYFDTSTGFVDAIEEATEYLLN